jgi:quinolinate synthase
MYFTLPQEYREASPAELKKRIFAAKTALGRNVLILTHHYQRMEIVELGDAVGDSYGLSKIASESIAEYIIFCGVHFMAEAAHILSKCDQKVFLPNPLAGCPMADMAEMADVLEAWKVLENFGGDTRIMPISYMNSAAELKSFCGQHGGLICTSSNADAVYRYGLERREKLFFFPDQHLGYNTGIKFGLNPGDMVIWDFFKEKGGLTDQQIEQAKVILWKGHCHVHTNFKPEHIKEIREKHPGAKIVVHPECPYDVVALADAAGSTSFIVKYVEAQQPGTTIAIGTEINLITRLAHKHPELKIMELSGQTCPVCANMYRTTINDLAHCIENLDKIKPIVVPEDTRKFALIALERMLQVY